MGEVTGVHSIQQIPHILNREGFFIAYPAFEAIKSIKNELGEKLDFTTKVLRFYGKELLFFKLKNGLYKELNILMNSGKSLSIDFSQYSYKSVFTKFLELEKQYQFYDIKIANVYVWELIRVAVFEHILEATGVLDRHFSKPNPVNNTYFGESREMPPQQRLLFEFPRKGNVDFRTLAFQKEFCAETNIFEYPQKDGYLASYNDQGNVFPIKPFLDYCQKDNTVITYSSEDKRIIRWFKQLFIEQLGIDIEFSHFINARLIKFLREYHYFNEFFDKNSYKEVVIPSAYWSAGIIAAARQHGIITADIQYALISPLHPSFAFDTEARAYGPDRVYLWSSYWNIKETTYNKSFVLQSNYFKEKLTHLGIEIGQTTNQYDVAFVSQSRIGRRIFNFVLDFARDNPTLKIVFCPHPDELVSEYPRFNELAGYPNVVVNSNIETLMIMSQSRNVVGVYSTSLIEALALGKEVYSLEIGGHEVMEREVSKGYIEYVSSSSELALKMQIAEEKTEKADYAKLFYHLK